MIINRASTLLAGLLATLASTGHTATIDLSFAQVLLQPAGGLNNPLLDLQISDTAVANQLVFTVSALGLTGTETLDGIALNLSSAQASKLLSVTASNQSPLGAVPAAFNLIPTGTSTSLPAINGQPAVNGSAFSPNQNLQPGNPIGGNFDFYLKFPAGQLTAAAGGSKTDSFTLTFSEVAGSGATVTASNFLNTSATNSKGGGYYAEAAISNSSGVGASGLSYIAAAPVPEPESLPLLLSGLGLVGLFASRKKRPE